MTGYPFIRELFTNVLQKSKAIGGRFHLCPRSGAEFNNPTLEDIIGPTITAQKFPLVAMMPPTMRGDTKFNSAAYQDVNCVLFFLTGSYIGPQGQALDPNPLTGTSQHQIYHDWHDMKRAAEDFVRVLDRLQRTTTLKNYFRLTGDQDKIYHPVSIVGAERASGIRLDLACQLFVGCEIEDYSMENLSEIIIPAPDSHPNHF